MHFFITEHELQPAVPCFGRTDCVDSLTLSRVVYNTSTTSCGVQDPFNDFEVPDVNNDFRATLQVEFKTNRKIEDCGVNIEVTCVSPNFFFSPECTSPDMFPQEELTTTEAATETMAITQTVPPTRRTTVSPPRYPKKVTPPTAVTKTKQTVTGQNEPTTVTLPTKTIPTAQTVSKQISQDVPTTDSRPTHYETASPTYKHNYKRSKPYFTVSSKSSCTS